MQVERDRIVEANIFGIERFALQHARGEGHDPSVLAPHEKPHLVRHTRPQAAKIRLRQLLEMQLRAMVDVEVQGIHLVDEGRDIADNVQLDRRCLCGRAKFSPQLRAGRAVKRAHHVVVEARVIDAHTRHRHARYPGKTMLAKTVERRSVFGRKLLHDDEPCAKRPGMPNDGAREYPRVGGAGVLFHRVEMTFARNTANHERAQLHEPREQATQEFDGTFERGTNSGEHILIEEEKRLHRLNLPGGVLDHEISVIELRMDRVLDEFVIAVILPLRLECVRPIPALCQLAPRIHVYSMRYFHYSGSRRPNRTELPRSLKHLNTEDSQGT